MGFQKTFTNRAILFCAFFCFLLPMSLAHANQENITLVYTGNLDGELEPCGCSEGGDKGGLKRRAQAIDDFRKEDPNLFLISTGGLITSEVAQDKLKSQYILKGMSMLNYDAIAVQWKDLSFGTEFLQENALPLVITNTQTHFSQQKIIQHNETKIAFFNWLDPSKNPQKNTIGSLAKFGTIDLAEKLKAAKLANQVTVLSTTLRLKIAQRRLPLEHVDILLIKAKYEHYGQPKQLGNMLVLQPGSRGMRIGKLTFSLSDTHQIINWSHQITPLPESIPDAPRMNDWYANYNADVKADYEKSVAIRKNLATSESPFAGEAICKQCHVKEHEKWNNTRHAEAFYSLQDVNKAFDPNCIQCHTVGFNTAGGFIEPSITKNLMHVQCENCHGAAKAHANSAGQKPVANKNGDKQQMCKQCHIQKHSPDFNYSSYWPKIAH